MTIFWIYNFCIWTYKFLNIYVQYKIFKISIDKKNTENWREKNQHKYNSLFPEEFNNGEVLIKIPEDEYHSLTQELSNSEWIEEKLQIGILFEKFYKKSAQLGALRFFLVKVRKTLVFIPGPPLCILICIFFQRFVRLIISGVED